MTNRVSRSGAAWLVVAILADAGATFGGAPTVAEQPPPAPLANLSDHELYRPRPAFEVTGLSRAEAELLFAESLAGVFFANGRAVVLVEEDRRVATGHSILGTARADGRCAELEPVHLAAFSRQVQAETATKASGPTGQFIVMMPAGLDSLPGGSAPPVAPEGATPEAKVTTSGVLLDESFEGSFPGRWRHRDFTNGDYAWAASACDSHSGLRAADAVRGGSRGAALGCEAPYPHGVTTSIEDSECEVVYGASEAWVEAHILVQAEEATGDDFLFIGYPTDDGSYRWGYSFYGSWSDPWWRVLLNMKQWFMLGDLTARQCNTLSLGFRSDASAAPGFGARVDDIVVRTGPPPGLSCSISADLLSGPPPLTVHFTGDHSGGTGSESFAWNFGDGTTSTQRNPAHTFTQEGEYPVRFSVRGSHLECIAHVTVTARSSGPAPVADFAFSPTEPVVGQAVQFVDRSTGSPHSWSWDFGDGTTSTTQSPGHAFASTGDHTVRLTVTNGWGSDSASRRVQVSPAASNPRARFVPGSFNVVPGQTVRFFNLSENASDFAWFFGDGESSTQPMPLHQYLDPGLFRVSLTACEGTRCDTVIVPIQVMEAAARVSGTVLVEEEPPRHSGMVLFLPQWGSWWYRFTHNEHANFQADDGRWSIDGLPFGAYRMIVSSDVEHCCGCAPGDPTHNDWMSDLVVVEQANQVFDVTAECVVRNPFDDVSPGVLNCVSALLGVLPGAATVAKVGQIASDLLYYQEALDCGAECRCEGRWAVFDYYYNVATLPFAEFPPMSIIDVTVACLLEPLGEWLSCDLPDLKSLSPGAVLALGNPAAFLEAQVSTGTPPSMVLESPFGERAELVGGQTSSTFEDPVVLSPAANGVGAALLVPSGVEEVVVTNTSAASARVVLPVYWFRDGRLTAKKFELDMPGGAQARGALATMVDDGTLTLVTGQTSQVVSAVLELEQRVPEYHLPAAAHLQGAGGSTWRTDLVVANPTNEPVSYTAAYFVPEHSEPVAAVQRSLPAGGLERLDDVVLSELEQPSANGWIRVLAQEPVLTAQRTYSQSADGSTQGQLLPALEPPTEQRPELTFVAVEENDGFRTNLGLLNASRLPNRATLELFGDNGVSLGTSEALLDPYQQVQLNRVVQTVAGDGTTVNGGCLVVSFDHAGGTAYLSKVDNSSNDPLTVLPQRAADFWLPAVIEAPGATGAQWRTDLRVHPTDSTSPVQLTLTLEPQHVTRQLSLPPSTSTHDLSNLFDLLGVTGEVGMLHVVASQEVYVVCRVYSAAAQGNRGQGIPMVVPTRRDQTLTAGETGHLVGLRADDRYRTNIALQNYGATSAAVTVRVYGGNGELAATWSPALPARQFTQLPLSQLVPAIAVARAEVECVSGGPVGAYASLVDNLSNDGSFFPLMRYASGASTAAAPDMSPVLTAVAQSSSQIDLSWTAVDRAAGYRLYRGSTPLYDGPAHSYSDTELSPSTEYCYTVVAHNAAGEGPTSGQGCATTQEVVGTGCAAGEEVTYTLPGGVPLRMVCIPAGAFAMGALDGERGADPDEYPRHQVTLTDSLWLGVFEVTQAQWQAVMGTNPSHFSACGGTCPVESVSWMNVAAAGGFVERINQQLGTTAFRLPTEAEWERAARAGTSSRFSHGDALECGDECDLCTLHDHHMWWCANATERTHPAGLKQANGYGLFDMHGNVWEWVSDWHGSYPAAPGIDPQGPPSGSLRALRGGAWTNGAENCRSANRTSLHPGSGSEAVGFRIARSP